MKPLRNRLSSVGGVIAIYCRMRFKWNTQMESPLMFHGIRYCLPNLFRLYYYLRCGDCIAVEELYHGRVSLVLHVLRVSRVPATARMRI